jgi:hypothetical protein
MKSLRFIIPVFLFTLYLWWEYRTFHDPDDPYGVGSAIFYFITSFVSTILGVTAFATFLSAKKKLFSLWMNLGLLFGSLSAMHLLTFMQSTSGDNYFQMDLTLQVILAVPVIIFLLNAFLAIRMAFRK